MKMRLVVAATLLGCATSVGSADTSIGQITAIARLHDCRSECGATGACQLISVEKTRVTFGSRRGKRCRKNADGITASGLLPAKLGDRPNISERQSA
jgi:hypothetical protein